MVSIAHPERYSLVFDADGTAVLTADCYQSIWNYTLDNGLGKGLLAGRPGSRFALQQGPALVHGCEPAGDPALEAPGGHAEEICQRCSARTWGLEFRSGALVLLRPLETDPFLGTYPDKHPLEQVSSQHRANRRAVAVVSETTARQAPRAMTTPSSEPTPAWRSCSGRILTRTL